MRLNKNTFVAKLVYLRACFPRKTQDGVGNPGEGFLSRPFVVLHKRLYTCYRQVLLL